LENKLLKVFGSLSIINIKGLQKLLKVCHNLLKVEDEINYFYSLYNLIS
jgi:hypothetical protein